MIQNDINYKDLVQEHLQKYMPEERSSYSRLYESVKYSLMAPGKRIRPTLTLLFCKLCSGDIKKALPFACAIEMIHTYSLIHDDLPCMDDDDMRRGRPSNHIVHGENVALLSGDALLSLAFEVALCGDNLDESDIPNAYKAARVLAVESRKMVEGQVIDLENEGKQVDIEILREMDEKKTCALISAACEMGCIMAGASDNDRKAAREFAFSIGMAFQIMDDILDVTADEKALGKPVGSDKSNNKSNYVSILGLEKSKVLVDEYTQSAIKALDQFTGDTKDLADLALKLSSRNK